MKDYTFLVTLTFHEDISKEQLEEVSGNILGAIVPLTGCRDLGYGTNRIAPEDNFTTKVSVSPKDSTYKVTAK